jgi:hypothetical protein
VKKIVTIFLLLIYGSATIGATFHLHYCMNEFVGWSLWYGNKAKKCGKCGMKEKKGGCCKDEQVQFKAEHQKAATTQYIQKYEVPVSPLPFETFHFTLYVVTETFPASHAPPEITNERLYALYGVFLI